MMGDLFAFLMNKIIQPREANFVTFMWFETPVKNWNDALSISCNIKFDKECN